MRLKTIVLSLLLLISHQAYSTRYTTPGDGTTYSFSLLSQIEGSGVTYDNGVYLITSTCIISEGDYFKIDEGVVVEFGNEAELILQGESDLRATSPTLLTRHGESATCVGILIQNSSQATEAFNLQFEYVGLRGGTTKGMNVEQCSFKYHNGTTSSALFLGGNGARFNIKNCYFEQCEKAAVGGAANYSCPVIIEGCTFVKNSQANGNVPQVNLTAADSIIVRHCMVTGDSTLNMVGGIAVANWFGTGIHHVLINDCEIRDNRYGITTMGILDVAITDNLIINNQFETNPNNGGSGISLYDPYLQQKAVISGNQIEKNLWGITVIGCGDVNLGKTEIPESAEDYNPGRNIFVDNGNNGMPCDLYNNSSNTIYAQGNIWSVAVQDAANIEEVVFHQADNPALGEVIYLPAGTPSSINPITQVQPSHTVYNLYGIPQGTVLNTLSKGIYIINGKKIMK